MTTASKAINSVYVYMARSRKLSQLLSTYPVLEGGGGGGGMGIVALSISSHVQIQ